MQSNSITVVTLADVFFGDHHHHSSPTFFEISKKNWRGTHHHHRSFFRCSSVTLFLSSEFFSNDIVVGSLWKHVEKEKLKEGKYHERYRRPLHTHNSKQILDQNFLRPFTPTKTSRKRMQWRSGKIKFAGTSEFAQKE